MIEAYKMNFLFNKPVMIASKTFEHNSRDLLLIKNNDLTGYGEALPDPVITKDTQEKVFEYLKINKDMIPNRFALDTIQEIHKQLQDGSPTARAAIDYAMHDLWGKTEGKEPA